MSLTIWEVLVRRGLLHPRHTSSEAWTIDRANRMHAAINKVYDDAERRMFEIAYQPSSRNNYWR